MTDAPRARGQDVSGLYQNPAEMRYDLWRNLGFCYGFYSVAIGLNRIRWAAEHRSAMRAANYLTAPYSVLSEIGDAGEQCRLLLSLRGQADELPNMLDVERERATEPMLRAWCDTYDASTDRELVIYTGWPWWISHVPQPARGRYAKYSLLIAGYPFDSPGEQPMDAASIARRSSPPVTQRPGIPSPWTREWAWQHSGHGRLPGYGRDLDLQVHTLTEAELRTRYKTGSVPAPAEDAVLAARILGHVAAMRALLES